MARKSPNLVIMGTGAGKSLLIILLAFSIYEGTAIVIVPLISLQDYLKRRCDDLGIASCIWDSRMPTKVYPLFSSHQSQQSPRDLQIS
jgi:superfamily II DNA helicase RecQ